MTSDPATWIGFVALSGAVICTPGPDTALTVRNATLGGRRSGIATAAGVASGQLLWMLASVTGVTGLLAASDAAFALLQGFGAAYLTWLGARSVVAAVRGRPEVATEPGRPGSAWVSPGVAFREGFLSDLTNPKVAAFFFSLLPQVVGEDGSAAGSMAVFGTIFTCLTLGWLALVGVAVEAARAALARPTLRRAVDGVTGLVLLGFALALATRL